MKQPKPIDRGRMKMRAVGETKIGYISNNQHHVDLAHNWLGCLIERIYRSK